MTKNKRATFRPIKRRIVGSSYPGLNRQIAVIGNRSGIYTQIAAHGSGPFPLTKQGVLNYNRQRIMNNV